MYVILTIPIGFRDIEFNWIDIPQDTVVFLDNKEGVAYWQGHHFCLDHNEYSLIN